MYFIFVYILYKLPVELRMITARFLRKVSYSDEKQI